VQTTIRANVKLAEAPSHGKTIFEYDPSSNGAKDYAALAAELLGEIAPPPDDEEETAAAPAADDAVTDEATPADETPAEPSADAPASGISYPPGVEREFRAAPEDPPATAPAAADEPPTVSRIEETAAEPAPADEVASSERPWSD
jgi:hypothetical protein